MTMGTAALLGRLLPDDDPAELDVRQGQFHQVVLGADRVVCFPRTEAAARRLPARAAVLRVLAGLGLGFRTPEPLLASGDTADDVPFLVLSRVPGAPLTDDALRDSAVAEAVAGQYATLLAGLSEAGADRTVRAALPHAREDGWRRFAAGVREELYVLMSDSGRRRAERELTALVGLPHLTGAVVHGDLGPENVLWEAGGTAGTGGTGGTGGGLPRLGGVVDWDEAALGDPAEDLAAIGAGHGEEFLARVLRLGAWSDDALHDRIATIRASFALQQALAAHRDGDEEERADGLASYAAVVGPGRQRQR
ncbi:phosphotransferase family protein [Streptomyces sp. NBC_01506]|uniref:phosphotransferase family protein n=1 Tax=Streptomyces sp. NBC_01506 TaxID=2903887 RepID=UPI0038638F3A